MDICGTVGASAVLRVLTCARSMPSCVPWASVHSCGRVCMCRVRVLWGMPAKPPQAPPSANVLAQCTHPQMPGASPLPAPVAPFSQEVPMLKGAGSMGWVHTQGCKSQPTPAVPSQQLIATKCKLQLP